MTPAEQEYLVLIKHELGLDYQSPGKKVAFAFLLPNQRGSLSSEMGPQLWYHDLSSWSCFFVKLHPSADLVRAAGER